MNYTKRISYHHIPSLINYHPLHIHSSLYSNQLIHHPQYYPFSSKIYRKWLDNRYDDDYKSQTHATTSNTPLNNIIGTSHLIPSTHDIMTQFIEYDSNGYEVDQINDREYSVEELIQREHTLHCMNKNINLELHVIDMNHAINDKINSSDVIMRDICHRTRYTEYNAQTFDNELITEKIHTEYEIRYINDQHQTYYILDEHNKHTYSRVYITVDWIVQRTRMNMGLDSHHCTITLKSNEENMTRIDSDQPEIIHKLCELSDRDNLINRDKLIEFKHVIGADQLDNNDYIWLIAFLSSHPSDYLFDVISHGIEL